MSRTTRLLIDQRFIGAEQIKTDESVSILTHDVFKNWNLMLDWYKGFKSNPCEPRKRELLKRLLFDQLSTSIYLLDSPVVVIFKWPNRELRHFLVTKNGNLIEANDSSMWDRWFPFLQTESGQLKQINIPSNANTLDLEQMVWSQESNNYSHFLFDFFSPLSFLVNHSSFREYSNKFILPYFSDMTWQREFFDLIPSLRLRNMRENFYGDFLIMRPRKLLIPMIPHKCLSTHYLRDFLNSTDLVSGKSHQILNCESRLIMITRYDLRRKRIRNIDVLESIVKKHGGLLLEASTLTIGQKKQIMCKAQICIGEGSALQNFALFAPINARIISLLDPTILVDDLYILGGWPYMQYFSSRTSHIVGSDHQPLPGSPLGSCVYDENIFKSLIRKYI